MGRRRPTVKAGLCLAKLLLLACHVQGLDTVMYGDSIMERFRGTLAGNASADYAPNKAAWERVYGGQR